VLRYETESVSNEVSELVYLNRTHCRGADMA